MRTNNVVDRASQILGTKKWVVARRLTRRLRERGYDLAVSNERLDAALSQARKELGIVERCTFCGAVQP